MENTNKIEILRALCYDKDDMTLIKNPPESFSQSEIDCVVEFKKMYEQGLGEDGKKGLKRFINRLLKEGSDGKIDSYTINYFVRELLNGPFGNYVREYTMSASSPKPFFKKSPETMGCLGDASRSPANIPVCPDTSYSSGTFPTISMKIPSFMTSVIQRASKATEDLFRSNMQPTWGMDNTLPLIDKKPQQRVSSEPQGGYDKTPIGNYCVKDVTDFTEVKQNLGSLMQGNVKKVLGENTDYEKLYLYKKTTNNFEKNSTSKNHKIQKMYVDGDATEVIVQDLFGKEFETDRKLSAKLKVDTGETVKEYALNTNEGQLGN